jgi:hypothetical protein
MDITIALVSEAVFTSQRICSKSLVTSAGKKLTQCLAFASAKSFMVYQTKHLPG